MRVRAIQKADNDTREDQFVSVTGYDETASCGHDQQPAHAAPACRDERRGVAAAGIGLAPMVSAIASAAPLLMPSSEGEAIGFVVRVCSSVPASASLRRSGQRPGFAANEGFAPALLVALAPIEQQGADCVCSGNGMAEVTGSGSARK